MLHGAGDHLGDGPLSGYDHLALYVRLILNFIGIGDVTTFAVEATTADAETVERARYTATGQVSGHFSKAAA